MIQIQSPNSTTKTFQRSKNFNLTSVLNDLGQIFLIIHICDFSVKKKIYQSINEHNKFMLELIQNYTNPHVLGTKLNYLRQSYLCCHHQLGHLAQLSAIEVLVTMPMTRWLFRIVPCLAGRNTFAICHKTLVMRPADVQ